MDDLPAEILARVFETGIHQWGVGFLLSPCLTCKHWYFVIQTTPRLWGIIVLDKNTDGQTFLAQLSKAKASPLSVTIRAAPSRILGRSNLLDLAPNWIYADVPTRVLTTSKNWSQFPALETLILTGDTQPSRDSDSGVLQDTLTVSDLPRLRSLTVDSVSTSWMRRLLSSRIVHFKWIKRRNLGQRPRYYWEWYPQGVQEITPISVTLGCLSMIPDVAVLTLSRIVHDPNHNASLITLDKLTVLEMDSVSHFTSILINMRVPTLQSLTITSYTPDTDSLVTPLSAVFADWSQPNSLPSQLTNLELYHCLRKEDMLYLILWLRRLPKMARLSLQFDEWDDLPEESSILHALSIPYEDNGRENCLSWLCPSLVSLSVEGEVSVRNLLPIARVRSAIPNNGQLASLAKLGSICAPLCHNGSDEEIEELRRIEEVICSCFACQLHANDDPCDIGEVIGLEM